MTFLFVTHSTRTAKSFCNRGIVMKKGCMIFDGDIDSAAEFYEASIEEELQKKKSKKKANSAKSKPKENHE